MGNITKERKARTMLKEFVDKILSLSCIQTIAVGEHTYARSEDRLTRIKPPQLKAPEPLHFCTLGGLVEYIDKEIDHIELQAPFIHAVSFDTIALCGWIIPENDNERFMYAIAELAQSGFSFDTWMDLETFNIALQSMFVMDETVERLLSVIGNPWQAKPSAKITTTDSARPCKSKQGSPQRQTSPSKTRSPFDLTELSARSSSRPQTSFSAYAITTASNAPCLSQTAASGKSTRSTISRLG
jgi:hypothetical protein